jgi:methionyl-tRNA formyltransferase
MVTAPSLRVVFLGTPRFAVSTLTRLLASRHEVVGVVTQPDRPRGRGQKTSDAPVKASALEAGIPVLQPATLKDPAALDALRAFRADLGVVAAFGKILSETVINTPRLGMINVHASLLPLYRGAAPIHRAVIAGETTTGVTIMRVVKALDAGPMLANVETPIHSDATSEDVERTLAELGAELLVATVDRLSQGPVLETPQDDSRATYAKRLEKDDGIIDWSRTANAVHNQIRGLHPWPHAYTFHQMTRLILHRSRMTDVVSDQPPGSILIAAGNELVVSTGSGALAVTEIQLEGKRPMSVRDFLAGHRLTAGDRLATTP